MTYTLTIEKPAPATFVVSPAGELDAYTAPELKGELIQLIESGGAELLVVDLGDVVFLDSTALGVLIGALKRLRERGGDFRLVQPRPDVRRILEITALDRVLPLYATREEALGSDPEGSDPRITPPAA